MLNHSKDDEANIINRMSNQDTNLRTLLSPSRSGTLFAPFRSRSANPDGFDSKMKMWISAIEEWSIINKKLTLSLKDIHQIFVSDAGIRPDKECIRLVFSEMKRRSRLLPLNTLKATKFWSAARSQPLIDSLIDPKGWLGWGVKNFVYNPASWALSALTTSDEQCYSDLTDMSITDTMKFVSQKSLQKLSQDLYEELVRISKAEKQTCFEWQHLLELVIPIVNTIIDAIDSKELLEMLDILIEYLAHSKRLAIQTDNDSKLIKISTPEDSNDEDVSITKKDIAMARLLRAKEILTADADKYHSQAMKAKQSALECYTKKEIAKAKSLLRSHKRLLSCAEQKEAQLTNVEIMLEQLENTNSNMIILQAYKDGADALRIANTNLENNTSILEDVYDATAEARHLNEEMNQMLKDISYMSQGVHSASKSELEAELADIVANDNAPTVNNTPAKQTNTRATADVSIEHNSLDDLEERLNNLVVCQEPLNQESPNGSKSKELTPKKRIVVPSIVL